MTWECPKCGREEYGPLAEVHLCPVCREEMAPVVETTRDGETKKIVLEKLED